MRYIRYFLIFWALLGFSFAITLDDLERLDSLDRLQYIKEAKQNADKNEFKKAYEFLKEAKIIGLSQADYKTTKSYIQKKETTYRARLEKERKERQSKGAYIVHWGNDIPVGNSIWSKFGVKMNNGKTFNVWLFRETSGFKCYEIMFNNLKAGATNCSGKTDGSWSVFCNSKNFSVFGDQIKVVKEIVARCGSY